MGGPTAITEVVAFLAGATRWVNGWHPRQVRSSLERLCHGLRAKRVPRQHVRAEVVLFDGNMPMTRPRRYVATH